jgi:hypothetical protein
VRPAIDWRVLNPSNTVYDSVGRIFAELWHGENS